MAQCKHHEVCGREATFEDGCCILHSEDPEKDGEAFEKAFETHRAKRGDNFSRMVFPSGHTRFSETTFEGDADFSKATFEGGVLFDEATFEGDVTFRDATFGGIAGFKSTFERKANFSKATFEEEALFNRVTFKGDASFGGATFRRGAYFRATFKEDVSFPKFKGRTTFEETTFEGETLFHSFEGDVSFWDVKFEEEATFAWVRFEEDVSFSKTTFGGETLFSEATFEEKASFENATFEGRVSFGGATFGGNVIFKATFEGKASFRGATFGGRSLFEGKEPFLAADGFLAEADFCKVHIDPLDALSFRKTDLSRCCLLGTDVRKIEFTGVRWAQRPNCHWREMRGNYVYDELYHRKQKREDPKHKIPWSALERLYRELKQNHEDRRDYGRAGDFHYREKEMRLRNGRTPKSHKVLLGAYWLLSGYGERVWPAAVWFLFIIALSAFLYLQIGIAPADGGAPLSWGLQYTGSWCGLGEALVYSARTSFLLSPDDFELTSVGAKIVNLVQTVISPIVLGLMALAIRHRLKR